MREREAEVKKWRPFVRNEGLVCESLKSENHGSTSLQRSLKFVYSRFAIDCLETLPAQRDRESPYGNQRKLRT
jgi:hypothetical protein